MISDEFAKSIPDIIKKIILSNKFDVEEDKCIIEKGVNFYIRIGTDFKNKLAVEDLTNNSLEPFVRPIGTYTNVTGNQFVNVIINKMREKSTKGSDQIQFVLNSFGVSIMANGRTLVKNKMINTSEIQRVTFTKSKNYILDPRLSSWSFIRYKSDPGYSD